MEDDDDFELPEDEDEEAAALFGGDGAEDEDEDEAAEFDRQLDEQADALEATSLQDMEDEDDDDGKSAAAAEDDDDDELTLADLQSGPLKQQQQSLDGLSDAELRKLGKKALSRTDPLFDFDEFERFADYAPGPRFSLAIRARTPAI